MSPEYSIYIILAFVAALLLAMFQYIYKSKLSKTLRYVFLGLRCTTYLCAILLLINPKFESFTYYNQKPILAVAVDNSESIAYLEQTQNLENALKTIQNNNALNDQFDIKYYSFGNTTTALDSLHFKEQQSNISETLTELNQVYANQTAPIVLITDGNQTYGEDYSFKISKQPVHGIILGDSLKQTDLSISQINVNRYVYLKNKFPIEIITNYSGNKAINTELKLYHNKTLVYKKTLQFSPENTSAIINTAILSTKVGVTAYTAELSPLDNEKNTANNRKRFAVEVIDQKTKIALVSDIFHPDLGAIKKAIESNEQRKVTILKPKDYITASKSYQLAILYQPNTLFNKVFDSISKNKLNSFIITGNATDYTILNAKNLGFNQVITNQTEAVQANFNTGYQTFILNDLNFETLPPLLSEFGELRFSAPNDVLLYKVMNGIETKQILLSTFESNTTKHAILSGEGIWRWRAHSFLEQDNFIAFDNFINKLIQYLSSNKQRKRLTVDYQSFYNENHNNLIIQAQYFNKNYELDPNATLNISLTKKSSQKTTIFPFLFNGSKYDVDLSSLEAGDYTFTVKHGTERITFSGAFKLIDYNVEEQFLNADFDKLSNLSQSTSGKTVFYKNLQQQINNLLGDSRYKTIQKSTKNIVPLIQWKYLLFIILSSMIIEWYIRKYNGLI